MPEIVEKLKDNIGDMLAVQRMLVQNHEDLGMSYDQAAWYVKGSENDAVEQLHGYAANIEQENYIIRDGLVITAFASLGDWRDIDRGRYLRNIKYKSTVAQEPMMYDMAKWFSVASYTDDFDSTARLLLESLAERSKQRGKMSLRIRVDAADDQMLDFFERTAQPLDRQLGEITLNGVTRGYLMYEANQRVE